MRFWPSLVASTADVGNHFDNGNDSFHAQPPQRPRPSHPTPMPNRSFAGIADAIRSSMAFRSIRLTA
ncbi:MAG: hypothetical protein MZU97_18260 [Bacillus subtilis]|nr:hypothetical protein [Bacillus subtilis]